MRSGSQRSRLQRLRDLLHIRSQNLLSTVQLCHCTQKLDPCSLDVSEDF